MGVKWALTSHPHVPTLYINHVYLVLAQNYQPWVLLVKRRSFIFISQIISLSSRLLIALLNDVLF